MSTSSASQPTRWAGHPTRARWLGILLAGLLLGPAVLADTPDAKAVPAVATGLAESGTAPSAAAIDAYRGVRPAEVWVGDSVVFTLQAEHAGRNAALRARSANDALHDILDAAEEDVHVEPTENNEIAVLYVGNRPVIQLTPLDAALAGDASLAVYADRVALRIRMALKTEQTRSAVAGGIFGASLAVLFAVIAIFLLRRSWQLADRAGSWLRGNPEEVPALRLGTRELAGRDTMRGALSLGVAVGRWIVLIGLLYAWLIATFSLFESTRGLTEKLTGTVFTPLATMASRIAAAVPLLVIVIFALLVLALLLRTVRLFFREVARGATVVNWLPRDLAGPIGTLAEIGIVLLALVLVAPVITGNADGAAPRIGLLALAAVALAAVPLAATAIVGIATVLGRWAAPGDWIEVGSRSGRVVRLGLLEITLRDTTGTELRLPHLMRLIHPARVHGRTLRITTSLPVDRRLATPELAERLVQALKPLGSDVVVELAEVGQQQAELRLALSSASADARSACLWAALGVVEKLDRESAAP